MIAYRCPDCRRIAFEAESPLPVVPLWACTRERCAFRGRPVYRRQPLQATYECSECGRRQHCERPKYDRTHCIVCGTETLVVVSEQLAPVGA